MKYKENTNMKIIYIYYVIYYLLYGEIIYCSYQKAKLVVGVNNFTFFMVFILPVLPGLVYLILRKMRMKYIDGLNLVQLILITSLFYDLNAYVFPKNLMKNWLFTIGVIFTFMLLFVGYFYYEMHRIE